MYKETELPFAKLDALDWFVVSELQPRVLLQLDILLTIPWNISALYGKLRFQVHPANQYEKILSTFKTKENIWTKNFIKSQKFSDVGTL